MTLLHAIWIVGWLSYCYFHFRQAVLVCNVIDRNVHTSGKNAVAASATSVKWQTLRRGFETTPIGELCVPYRNYPVVPDLSVFGYSCVMWCVGWAVAVHGRVVVCGCLHANGVLRVVLDVIAWAYSDARGCIS